MKLLLENWRQYLIESEQTCVFERELLEEGKIWDYIKDKASAASALKDKALQKALNIFIKTALEVKDEAKSVKEFIDEYVPPEMQAKALAAVAIFVASTGRSALAMKIAQGNAGMGDISGLIPGMLGERIETPT
tara:strand:- start:31 stop:432 length:402 start_codon:yes stop_codon:yes gene_type:complete